LTVEALGVGSRVSMVVYGVGKRDLGRRSSARFRSERMEKVRQAGVEEDWREERERACLRA
jgi:hypothetical protein